MPGLCAFGSEAHSGLRAGGPADARHPPGATALVPFLGYGIKGADAWVKMHTSDRRRLAMEAARGKDVAVLLSLTEAWMRTYSKAGATIAKATVENHTHGVRKLLAAWAEEDLLKPDTEAATRYIRTMERQGLKAGTIYGRVAAARALFSALRWARASLYDPFADVHVPHDPTPPWEKRMPYDNDEIAALLDAATNPLDRVLVLLGAHGGLRAGACVRLQWRDVNMTRRDLTIRLCKGGKTRTVGMSASVKQALQGLPRRPDGYVLPYRTPKTAWAHITALCEAAGVAPKGMHSLRHSAGTRLYAETGDLEETRSPLGPHEARHDADLREVERPQTPGDPEPVVERFCMGATMTCEGRSRPDVRIQGKRYPSAQPFHDLP